MAEQKTFMMIMETAWMGRRSVSGGSTKNDSGAEVKAESRRAAMGIKRSDRSVCVTKLEIAEYWRRKKMEEEEHLFSAIKAAARIKARTLTLREYRKFEESLITSTDKDSTTTAATTTGATANTDQWDKEIRLGIKDWWTRSWFAYLNQPTLSTADDPRRSTGSSYIPNRCCYTTHQPQLVTLGVL